MTERLADFCRAAGFDYVAPDASKSMIRHSPSGGLNFYELDSEADSALFVNILAALAANLEVDESVRTFSGFMEAIDKLLVKVDDAIQSRLSQVLRQPQFKEIERNWTMLSQIVDSVQSDNVQIDVLDVTKDELGDDIRDHANHIMGSSLFQRMYVGEFDRFGGVPFSSIVALFEFDPSND